MDRRTESPAKRTKWRRYMRKVSSSRSPISRGRRRNGTEALTACNCGAKSRADGPSRPSLPEWRDPCGDCCHSCPNGGKSRRVRDQAQDGGGLGLARRSRARRLLVLVLDRRELEVVLALDVDLHRVAAGDLPAKQVLREIVFDPARDHAPQRARAIDPVVALFRKK